MDEISGFFAAPSSDVPEGLALVYDSGAWCELWRGTRSGKFRCYKSLKPEFRGRPLYESLLRKEFDAGFSLDHPGIRRYISFMSHPELGNCIEMEWVDGERLDAILEKKGAPGREDARRIAEEILDAVEYVHSRNMVHKDLKPANILITHNGRHARIIDFGFADSDDSAFLRLRAGTDAYAAPELIAGSDVDCRTDIYALGKILGQLGIAPGRVVRRCCARRPEDRYGSVQALRRALGHRHTLLWTVFLLLVVLTAAALWLRRASFVVESVAVPDTPVTGIVEETAPEPIPSQTPEKEKPAAPAAAPVAPASVKAVADSLFREAEGIFSAEGVTRR